MPSNAELIADIDALSNELGQTVNVTGLKNDQLAKLLAGLRDEKAARASALPAPDAAAQAQAEAAALPAPTDLAVAAAELKAAADSLAPDAPAADAQAAADALGALMAPVQAPAEPAVKPYYMAPGKAVTSKAGILSGDTADEVKAEYFEGGDETLQTLVDGGYVLKS